MIQAIIKTRRGKLYDMQVRMIISQLCGEFGVDNLERFCDNFDSDIRKLQRRSWCYAWNLYELKKLEENFKLKKVEVWHLNSKNEPDSYKCNEKDAIYLLFAQDESGQLHVTLTTPEDENAVRIVKSSTATAFQGTNKGLIKHFSELFNKQELKFKFFISEAANQDGWFPVITNYKE